MNLIHTGEWWIDINSRIEGTLLTWGSRIQIRRGEDKGDMIGGNAVILVGQTASMREVAHPLTGVKTKLQEQIQPAQITLLGIDTTSIK
jgi:hypothetical protein